MYSRNAQNYQLIIFNAFSKFLPETLLYTLSNSVPIVIEIIEYLKHILSYPKIIGFKIQASWTLQPTAPPRNNLSPQKRAFLLGDIRVAPGIWKAIWLWKNSFPRIPRPSKSFLPLENLFGLTLTLLFSPETPCSQTSSGLLVWVLLVHPLGPLPVHFWPSVFHAPRERLLPSVDVKLHIQGWYWTLFYSYLKQTRFIHLHFQ